MGSVMPSGFILRQNESRLFKFLNARARRKMEKYEKKIKDRADRLDAVYEMYLLKLEVATGVKSEKEAGIKVKDSDSKILHNMQQTRLEMFALEDRLSSSKSSSSNTYTFTWSK